MSEEERKEGVAGPRRYRLSPGVHWWCRCGKTGHPPFCDGSHRGTGIQPERLELEAEELREWRKEPEKD